MTSNGAPEMLTCEPTVTPSSSAVVCPSTTTCACSLTCFCVKKTPVESVRALAMSHPGLLPCTVVDQLELVLTSVGGPFDDRRDSRDVRRIRLVLEARDVLHGQRVRRAGSAANPEARGATPGRDRQEIRTERGDARVDRIGGRGTDADGADHRSNAEENAECCEDRAQAVTEQTTHPVSNVRSRLMRPPDPGDGRRPSRRHARRRSRRLDRA